MLLLISVLAPMAGAAGLFLWRPQSRRACHIWTFAWTLLTSLLVGAAVFTRGGQAITLLRLTTNLTVSFKLDGLGRLFAGMVAFLWPLATLYAFEYMEHEGGDNHFFGFYMLSYGMTLAIAYAEDMMTMYVFYELLSLSTLFLVMHGMKAKTCTRAASTCTTCWAALRWASCRWLRWRTIPAAQTSSMAAFPALSLRPPRSFCPCS